MRLNKYIALCTGVSRRAADRLIAKDQVIVNGTPAQLGQIIDEINDKIELDRKLLLLPRSTSTILFHKPVGYICSRNGQGNATIYDILPKQYHHLKPVGRLDKNSSGLLLLTDNGDLAQQLTHPSYKKQKKYVIRLDKGLTVNDQEAIDHGVPLVDGLSKLTIEMLPDSNATTDWLVTMTEGRNRQIRRTFAHLGYHVTKLHRIQFGTFALDNLRSGEIKEL